MATDPRLRALRLAHGTVGRLAPHSAARLALRLFSTPKRRMPNGDDRALLAEGREAAFGDGLIATVWGDDHHPTVLLVHGWQRHRASLGAFVPPLLGLGRRVVAYDAPAHGDSAGVRTNLIGFLHGVQQAADTFGPVDAIVAHSLGANATVQAIARGLEVGRVVLLACPGDWDHQMRLYTDTVGLGPVATERFVALVEAIAERSLAELDAAEQSRAFASPALLFHDPDDARAPYRDSVALAAAWPGAELVTVAGLGHIDLLRDPEVVARAVAFVGGG